MRLLAKNKMAAKLQCWTRKSFLFNSLRILTERKSLLQCSCLRYLSSMTRTSLSSEENSQIPKILEETPQTIEDKYRTSVVHPEIVEIVEKSRPQLVGNNWHKPKLSARRVAELRKKYVGLGYYWPLRPLVDRGLDKTPKGHKYERDKEEKLAKIEENMRNMPKIIEEYRKKMRELRTKRKEERKISALKALEAKRAGIHPKDPRALAAFGEDTKNKSKWKKKK